MNSNQNHTKQQLDEFNFKNASRDLAKSGEKREELNEESLRIFNDFYDKILFYSAGAFSFSLALIGLVVKDKTQALVNIGFIFPNVYWLYLSLLMYLLVCTLVLLSKRFDAHYIGSFGAHYYTKSFSRYEKANIDWLSSHSNQVLIKNSNLDQEIKTSKINLSNSEEAEVRMENQFKMYFFLKKMCHLGSELLTLVATSTLFFFFVQLIQTIIWAN